MDSRLAVTVTAFTVALPGMKRRPRVPSRVRRGKTMSVTWQRFASAILLATFQKQTHLSNLFSVVLPLKRPL